ncbi:MAG: hypothetical protein JRD93_15670 [Deltaproteobacteria bacterium]|nr:hypothetical protein [Deltaproteobacteria bacterium]
MKNLKFTERTNLNSILFIFLGCLCLLFCCDIPLSMAGIDSLVKCRVETGCGTNRLRDEPVAGRNRLRDGLRDVP